MQKNIFLIGMPSAGKSTLGKALATQISYNFIDTDQVIETNEQKSIPSIFEIYGEMYFRTLEATFLDNFLPIQKTVVSTGGGMPCFNANLEKMKKLGTVIYLEVPLETLALRIYSTPQDRPLYVNKSGEEIGRILHHVFEKRKVFYEQADIVLRSPTVSDLLKLIIH